jgi:hypothetical protein
MTTPARSSANLASRDIGNPEVGMTMRDVSFHSVTRKRSREAAIPPDLATVIVWALVGLGLSAVAIALGYVADAGPAFY